tara:strand:- start:278 stop:1045 length:768 start_codon:yes stop_codon:yes gene_type:complete
MTFNLDDVQVGGQIMVGTGAPPAVGQGSKRINGSLYAEGPVLFGDQSTYGSAEATLMLAPLTNGDEDCPHPTDSLGVSGSLPMVLEAKGNFLLDGDMYVTGSVDCLSTGRLEARHSVADGLPKKFDIPHPSEEGMRLAHACIEGAEVGVYHRGRLRNEKEIFLPSYWKDLVHIDSITVQLQPIGAHQDIIIKRWDDEKIYLQARGGMPIDCFYHVYAERKDINPLTVEYKGETWEDYPDPTAEDPKYAGQNTITR